MLGQEGRDCLGLVKSGFGFRIKHVVKRIGILLCARIHQIRRIGIPVIEQDNRNRHSLVRQRADGLVISVHHAFIKMVRLSVILVINSGSHNLGKCDIGGHMLHAQVKGVAEHVNLNHKTLLSQRVIKRRLVLSNQLRVGYIVGLADLDEPSSVKYSQDKPAVKLILRCAQVQGHAYRGSA